MSMSETARGHLMAGAGGVILIVSLFLDWTGARTAWMDFTVVDIVMMVIGVAAILFALLPVLGEALPPSVELAMAASGSAAFGFAAAVELEFSSAVGVWVGIVGSAAIAFGSCQSIRTRIARPARTVPEPGPTAPRSP